MKKYTINWSKTSSGSIIVEAENKGQARAYAKKGQGAVHIEEINLVLESEPEEIKKEDLN